MSLTFLKFSALLGVLTLISYPTGCHGNQNESTSILERLANYSCGPDWECPLENKTMKFCYCDDLCDVARDCCQGNQRRVNTIFTTTSLVPENFVCVNQRLADAIYEIMMVHTCPTSWKEEEIRNLCEQTPISGGDIFKSLHVTGVRTGVTYKNQYCARCHGEKYEFWQPEVGCTEPFVTRDNPSKIPNLAELMARGEGCKIMSLKPPNGFQKRRCQRTVDQCPSAYNNMAVREACEAPNYTQPVSLLGRDLFKNIYCGMCHLDNPDLFQCPQEKQIIRNVEQYPFNILFDINNLEKITNSKDEVVVCEKHQVFDPFSGICRDALCPENMIIRDGECVLPSGTKTEEQQIGSECPRILLNKSEYKISDDGVLRVLNSNYLYGPGNYELTENGTGAMVCTNFTQNSTLSEVAYHLDNVQTILTVVGISLSTLGCLLTIAIYLSFKTLRNIPGKTVIGLCLSLILAYLAMLIGPSLEDSYAVCKAFAILMHYAFLLAFFWMNIMAIDVWYTFSKAYYQAGTQNRRTNRFKFYMLYVFIMASIPVALAVILNETEVSEEFSPHYGENLCWFTRKNALMIFFGLPTLLVTVSNIVLFAIAAKTIYVAQKNSARLLGKEEKGLLGIYVRLTFVMGLTYLFGFLAPVVDHPALWYVFIVLNTLQGVFIFVSFVLTNKVLGLARERASTISRHRSDNSYSGSRSTTKSTVFSTLK